MRLRPVARPVIGTYSSCGFARLSQTLRLCAAVMQSGMCSTVRLTSQVAGDHSAITVCIDIGSSGIDRCVDPSRRDHRCCERGGSTLLRVVLQTSAHPDPPYM